MTEATLTQAAGTAGGAPRAEPQTAPRWVFSVLAVTVGLMAANLYYAQPLVGPVAQDFGVSSSMAGLVVTATQLGYVAGLVLIVPLGDLVENRRLAVAVTTVSVVGLAAAAVVTGLGSFLVASVLVGIGSVAVQILVPLTSHLASDGTRGRALGTVTSGLMLGIMLARPTASLLAQVGSWRTVFAGAAVAMIATALVLWRVLPTRAPGGDLRYGRLLASMPRLVRTSPLLRRRAVYQFALFGSFSLFWTATPLLLVQRFGLSQAGVAAFAFAGVAGAIAAPVAGRAADRGWTRPATGIGIALALIAFVLPFLAPAGSTTALVLLTVAAVLLDLGVTANLTLSQRALFALGAAQRGRVNGVFMTTFYLGGALGSALGAVLYTTGGWGLAALVPAAALVATGVYHLAEPGRRNARSQRVRSAT